MDSKEIQKHTGKVIRKLRKDAGLTQGELGAKVGVTTSAISGYESGYRMPRENFLYAICDYFGVDLNIFYPKINTNPAIQSTAESKTTPTVTKIVEVAEKLNDTRQNNVLNYSTEQLNQQKYDTIDDVVEFEVDNH